jgi:hypothetical protein
MTKKDYELIADLLADLGENLIDEAYTQDSNGNGDGIVIDNAMALFQNTCIQFADKLAADNPRFNAVTFLTVCGLDNLVGEKWRTNYTN